MSCGCPKIERTGLWTPVPGFDRPGTDIQFGENIDCFAKRSGSSYGEQNVLGPKPVDRIDNTSITSDINGTVNEDFRLTPESTRTATNWTATVGGVDIETAIPDLQFDASTGLLSGTVRDAFRGKNYAVLVTAYEGSDPIDAREYNFYPKDGTKEDIIRFIFPLVGTGARITSPFGPRRSPTQMASRNHPGVDISCTEGLGDIVASADGVVTMIGPARGFGNWIHIDHFDSSNRKVATTLYAHMHLNTVTVRVGQRVSAGQKIAVEGNAGIGTGAHLHFEIHKGRYKNPVDPVPYLSGGPISVPVNTSDEMSPEGTATPSPETRTRNNGLTGMAAGESQTAECAPDPNGTNTSAPSGIDESVAANTINTQAAGNDLEPNTPENIEAVADSDEAKNPCIGITGRQYTPDEIRAIIRAECAAAGLDNDDADFLINIARIESSFNPYATNPTSSATGLFQMLNATAQENFTAIGYPNPTCEQRTNPELAVKAQIEWFRRFWLPQWNRFVASNKTKIVGKDISSTQFSGPNSSGQFYAGLTKSEFLYGLIHHDGVGNAVDGIDRGGVAYWRRRMTA